MKMIKRLQIEQKTIRVAITLALMLLTTVSAWAQDPASIGSIQYNSTLEAYEINSVANLNDLAVYVNGTGTYSTSGDETTAHNCEGLTFKQTANITYSGTNNYTPIGICVNNDGFQGTFDGQGNTISGIDCTGDGVTGEDESLGLFGRNRGTVRNVTLSGCRFASANNENNGNYAKSVSIGSIAGDNTGTISNCTVTSCTVSRTRTANANGFVAPIGGIAGENYGHITDCTYSGSVSGTYSGNDTNLCVIYIGGIAGISEDSGSIAGSITGCGSDATVSCSAPNVSTPFLNVGGIAGLNNGNPGNATVSDCFFSGSLSGTGKSGGNTDYIYIGAFVGKSINSSTVTNNYHYGDYASTIGDEAGEASHGNLVRVYQLTGNSITATAPEGCGTTFKGVSYFKAGATVTLAPQAGYVLTAACYNDGSDHEITPVNDVYTLTMPASNVTVTATLIDHWGIGDGADGSEAHPYIISTTTGLDLLATDVNGGESYSGKYFELGADIVYTHKAANEAGADTENNYTAIGHSIIVDPTTYKYTFNGIFDGNGKTISGIRIYRGSNNDADNFVGLFGSIGSNGMVKNVTLSDTRITGYHWVGGIAGRNVSGTIENCHVTSSVVLNAVQDHAQCFGGIAGEITEVSSSHAYILDCTSSVTITMAYENFANCVKFGGIVGNIKDAGIIEDCLAIGANIHVSIKSKVSQGGAILGDCNTTYVSLFLTNNYYCGCTLNGSTSYIGYKNSDIRTGDIFVNNGAVEAVLLSETQTSMPTAVSTEMVFRRSFTKDVASTICLPFSIDAVQAAAAGKFYRFGGVDKTGSDWEVIMYETYKAPDIDAKTPDIDANTPYLFVPNATGHVLFHGSALSTIEAGYTDAAGWIFQGTYTSLTYGTNLDGNVYGFAANNYDGDSYAVSPGDFVKAMTGATVVPFRCYLTYSGSSTSRGAADSEALPAKITVRLIGNDGNTTRIETTNFTNEAGAEWYSLDGRRLSGKPSAKGIYIRNGRKEVVK